MNLSESTLKQWLQLRTQKERIGITVLIFLFCIWIWNMLWENYYQTNQQSLTSQIETLQQKISTTQQEDAAIKKMLADPNLAQKRLALKNELRDMNSQLNAISTQLISSAEMVKALESILAEDPNLSLTRLQNMGNSLMTSNNKQKKALKLYRHDFILEFNGDYFSTLTYLKKLETLPWQLYWDNIEYQVSKYPNAHITIKLHTLSTDEGLINA